MVLALTLWLAPPGFAEDEPQAAGEPQPEAEQQSSVARSAEAQEERDEEFDPSEEIVEDYSVPFPVDI